MTPLTPEQMARVQAKANAAYERAADMLLARFPPDVREGVVRMCEDFREYALYHVDDFVPEAWQDAGMIAFLTLMLHTTAATQAALREETQAQRSFLQ